MFKDDKNQLYGLSTGTLAEFTAQTAAHDVQALKFLKKTVGQSASLFEQHVIAVQDIAASLSTAKKFAYDIPLKELVHSTRQLDTEDMIGQLSHTTFPFDKMWFEGPTPLIEGPSALRLGALVAANQDDGSFTLRYVHESYYIPEKDPHIEIGRRAAFCVLDGKSVYSIPIAIKVSMDGIKFDEDKLLSFLFGMEKVDKAFDNTGDMSNNIDHIYKTADFFTRMFVVMSSENVPNNFKHPKTKHELDFEAKNKRRMQMGKLPILETTPITIDLAQASPGLLNPQTPKETRQLLGWTSVRRSKEIVSKYGKIFRRKAHERRIAAPVDRRDAAREITSSNPNLGLEIRNERPQLTPQALRTQPSNE